VSDKEIQVGEIDRSKRERKKQHLEELKSAAANEDVPHSLLCHHLTEHCAFRAQDHCSSFIHCVVVFVFTCSKKLVLSCLAPSYTSTPQSIASLVS
jgi:hypothetical protein